MKKGNRTGGIESTFYMGMFNWTEDETRTADEIFYNAVMRSLDGVLSLTDGEVLFINNNRDSGSPEIDCLGMEIEFCEVAA